MLRYCPYNLMKLEEVRFAREFVLKSLVGHKLAIQAKFRRRTSHEPNQMQMGKIVCFPSLAFDSVQV